jgi:hypothetical protein
MSVWNITSGGDRIHAKGDSTPVESLCAKKAARQKNDLKACNLSTHQKNIGDETAQEIKAWTKRSG